MAALLLDCHYNISVTDKACTWITRQNKEDETKALDELYPSKNYRATSGDATEGDIEELRQSLCSLGLPVGFTWFLSKEPNPEDLDICTDIEKLLFSQEYLDQSDRLSYFLEKVSLRREEILRIVQDTQGQSTNIKWLVARKHRLTASKFGPVLNAIRRGKYSKSLFNTLTGIFILLKLLFFRCNNFFVFFFQKAIICQIFEVFNGVKFMKKWP